MLRGFRLLRTSCAGRRPVRSFSTQSSVDAAEVAKFSRASAEWWDPRGVFAALHRLNPTRMLYIRNRLCDHFKLSSSDIRPLAGLKAVDVGCGGGLVAECLSRLGATVLGIDASQHNIAIARAHALRDPTLYNLQYQHTTAEDLVRRGDRFDIVCALEVVEHVTAPKPFIASLSNLLSPNAALFLGTINRTMQSYALAIVAAEYVLGWVPRGTHDWNKFLTPAELISYVEQTNSEPSLSSNDNPAKMLVSECMGMVYDVWTQRWRLDSSDLTVNYMLAATSKPTGG